MKDCVADLGMGYKDGSDATPVFCVASRTPLVVVAKP